MRNSMKLISGKKAFLFFMFSGIAYSSLAETVPSVNDAQRNIDRLERERLQQQITTEKQREREIQRENRKQDANDEALKNESRYKFDIKEILIENDTKFEFSAQRNAIIERYLNTNMGEQEVLALVKELTDFYIGQGYVTTQVTIAPGSLRSGKLVLRILWGKIAGFLHNGEGAGWREKTRMFSAMPFAKESLLSMSDIDQGLDNLLRVSQSDKLVIEASEKSGYSLINHTGENVFPLSVYLGMNNSGYRDSGWYQYSLNTSLKNVLGLNDTFTYYYSYNDLYADTDSQSAKSFSFNVPLGYWLFDSSYYKSAYKKIIGGVYGGYVSDGQSERFSLKATRTLFRNASGKYSGWLKVEKKNNENNIMGFPIAVSSKKYSSLSTGLTWVGTLAGGWGYADLNMTAGMPWFGAAWKGDSDLTGFDLNYKKFNGTLNWGTRLAANDSGRVALDYELSSGWQFTNDRLVSDAKYSLGDEYSVRGYKEQIVSAERAIWVSNTLKLPVQINYARIYAVSPFTGFDIGMARKNCVSTVSYCERDYMSGAVAGVKLSGKDFSGSVAAGWPVKKPASLSNSEVDNYAMYMNLNVGF